MTEREPPQNQRDLSEFRSELVGKGAEDTKKILLAFVEEKSSGAGDAASLARSRFEAFLLAVELCYTTGHITLNEELFGMAEDALRALPLAEREEAKKRLDAKWKETGF